MAAAISIAWLSPAFPNSHSTAEEHVRSEGRRHEAIRVQPPGSEVQELRCPNQRSRSNSRVYCDNQGTWRRNSRPGPSPGPSPRRIPRLRPSRTNDTSHGFNRTIAFCL
ncbi:uncharacterized protein B0T15DRAFT_509210 [Chaetomium strumarium]|uniref:Uncharacterized protein n=1 Tax=Chaetomium strumarium TaxID=1170767 RepID=A0AAJ0M4I5_9PEZI|nr:hypothetical protein B0T15DRAFT_509210 [Chaetomium strumarium]